MLRRFFSHQPISGTGNEVLLSGSEAHHLLNVLRAQVGERVTVFDGRRGEYTAEIVETSRRVVRLLVAEFLDVDRELSFPLHLAVAMPRGDRQDWLVQKAVEVGVTRIIPWQTERSVAHPNDKTLKRFSRVVIEASKQCRRNRLMEISAPRALQELIAGEPTGTRFLAHAGPQSSSLADAVNQTSLARTHSDGIHLGIGPEGGFSDPEVQLALDNGWQSVGLGSQHYALRRPRLWRQHTLRCFSPIVQRADLGRRYPILLTYRLRCAG